MSSEKTLINNLTEGPIASKLIRFSLPFMLANLLQALYTMVDLTIVGQFVGSVGLSSVSVGGDIISIFTYISVGFATGGQIYISQLVGMKKTDELKRSIGTLITMMVLVSVLVLLLGVVFSDFALGVMNTPEASYAQAKAYLIICACGMPFVYLYNALCAVLRGMGDSKRPLLFIGVSTGTNIVLDLVFVALLHWDAAGAAIATALSQVICAALAVAYLVKNKERFHFDFKLQSFRMERSKLAAICKLGLPVVAQHITVTLSLLFVSSHVNAYGVVAAAVSGVGMKLTSIINIVTAAMQSSLSTMVGQNMGAGKVERAEKSVWIGWAICVGFWLILSVFCIFFPRQFFSLFNSEPEVLDLAEVYLKIINILFLNFALLSPPMGLAMGVGSTAYCMAISMTDGVVFRILLSVLFDAVFHMGMQGYWWASALSGFVSSIGFFLFFFFSKWRTKTPLAAK